MVELHRVGGTVRDSDDVPVAGAWVVLPESGLWAATDRQGRFLLNRIQPGEHSVVVRTVAGEESAVTAVVPGDRLDIVIGSEPSPDQKRRRPKTS
jgi:hypothetical protein